MGYLWWYSAMQCTVTNSHGILLNRRYARERGHPSRYTCKIRARQETVAISRGAMVGSKPWLFLTVLWQISITTLPTPDKPQVLLKFKSNQKTKNILKLYFEVYHQFHMYCIQYFQCLFSSNDCLLGRGTHQRTV